MRRIILAISIIAVLATPFLTRAQTNQPYILLTWKAETYTPPYYPGKALPIPNSRITVAADLVDQGKLIDLSSETIYWYLNDAFLSGGAGLTRISVTAPDTLGRNTVRLRAALPNYQGGIMKSIVISITLPEAVIESTLAKNEVKSETLDVRGWPYFFNIRNLSELLFSWSIAGKEPDTYTDPWALRITIDPALPRGTRIPVEMGIENPEHRFEAVVQKSTFTIAR